jgi:hypothetical protein
MERERSRWTAFVSARLRSRRLRVVTLSTVALVTWCASVALPLHLAGAGVFTTAFRFDVGLRLSLGQSLPAIILLGIFLASARRWSIATGVFLAAGVIAVLDGMTAPFFALPRPRPLLLMAMEIAVGLLLFAAAREAGKRDEPSSPNRLPRLPPVPGEGTHDAPPNAPADRYSGGGLNDTNSTAIPRR